MAQEALANKNIERRLRRTRLAVVEKHGSAKTIKVRIDRLIQHAKYRKYLKRRSYLAFAGSMFSTESSTRTTGSL